jgi:Holliday junction resolvase RusA-like endonuclease
VSEISFTVPGEPVPWARAGGGKTMHRFTPAKQRKYMARVRACCERAMTGRGPLSGPVEMSVMAVYAWPKSWSEKKRSAPLAKWKTSRPDMGNLSKLVEDALNNLAYGDDAQVVSPHGWKQYGDVPRLVVKIVPLDLSAF